MKTTNVSRSQQSGTQIAELAIVLPLLVFFSLIVAEGSGFVRAHLVLNNAAREGARIASQQQYENNVLAAGQQGACNYLVNNKSAFRTSTGDNWNGTSCGTVFTVTVADENSATPQWITLPNGDKMPAVKVTVQYVYPMIYLPRLPWFTNSSNVPLAGTAKFRKLY